MNREKAGRNFRILFFALLLLAGCTKSDTKIPEGVIPRDSMVVIMADVHVAESRLIKAGSKATAREVKSAYILQVLSKSGVDTTRFLKSFDFYATQPELFSEMYEEVVVEISKRQAEGRKIKKNGH